MATWDERRTGQFWLADTPERKVAGTLDTSALRPTIELIGTLSPFAVEVERDSPEVREFQAAEPLGPATIHGWLSEGATPVTVFDAVESGGTTHPMLLDFDQPYDGPQTQQFTGTFVLLGALFTDTATLISSARFRVSRQDEWASFSGLANTMKVTTPREFAFRYVEPEAISADLPDAQGVLSLEASATISPRRAAGGYILTTTWLSIDLAQPATIGEVWQRYVIPTTNLLTMLYNEKTPPVAFEVKDQSSDRWCEAKLPGLAKDTTDVHSSRIPPPPVVDRRLLGLERLARWFHVADTLYPLPGIVAGTIDDYDRTTANLLLELAATAEGLHRRLYPDARQLSQDEVNSAIAAFETSRDMPDSAKNILRNALKTYLSDFSFPKRLAQLAEDFGPAAPGVTGVTGRWKQAVTNARIGFAHALPGDHTRSDEVYSHRTLQHSLRWLLTTAILREIGLSDSEISQALTTYRPYQRFLAIAKETEPRIYG